MALPPGAFLQATADGEAALVEAVREAAAGAGRIADLFAGLGTFALALDAQVYAAEAARDAMLALGRRRRRVTVEHRDLYRRPLDGKRTGGVRRGRARSAARGGGGAGARRWRRRAVARIAYVSCNPATFARDAAMLVAGGYRLDWVRPVGQFRWSTHVELAAAFSAARAAHGARNRAPATVSPSRHSDDSRNRLKRY